MSWADTQQFITYRGNPLSRDLVSGTVDMRGYLQWLNDPAHGYGLNLNIVGATP